MTPIGSGTLGIVAAVMVVYMGALLVIAWRAARRTHGGDDFHLAGRSLGAWAAGISSTASSESGWVTLGAVGMTYAHGVSGLWYAPGCLLGYLVNLWLVAPRLRRLSRDQGSVTLTDVLTSRWGDPRQVVRLTATTIILIAMMGYVAAQMTAAGKAFSSIFPFEGRAGYLLGVVIGAVVITLVTSLGGFRAVAWTDLFQGLLMAGALLALPLWAILHLVGGFGALVDGLGAADPSFLTATGDRIGPAMWGFVIGELGIGLGYPGMPHVVTRYMATRSEGEIRRLRVIALLWGVAVFYGAGLVGLAGRVLMPGLADGEQTLMALALRFTHPVVAGLLLAAVISAILSTVSSQLLVAASAVSYDLVEKMLGRIGRRPPEPGAGTLDRGRGRRARDPGRAVRGPARVLVRALRVVGAGSQLRTPGPVRGHRRPRQPSRRPRRNAHRRRGHGGMEARPRRRRQPGRLRGGAVGRARLRGGHARGHGARAPARPRRGGGGGGRRGRHARLVVAGAARRPRQPLRAGAGLLPRRRCRARSEPRDRRALTTIKARQHRLAFFSMGGGKEAVSKTGQISCSEPERACSDARENVNRKDAKSAKYLV